MTLLDRLPEVSLKSDPEAADTDGKATGGSLVMAARQANPELLVHIIRYCAERRDTGEWNRRTADVLASRLYGFCASTTAKIGNIGHRQVRSWMATPDLAPSTRAQNLSALRGFFRWALGEGLVTKDPTAGINRPRVARGLNRSLSPEQVSKVIAVLPDDRARLIVSLMLNEAMRRAEVAAALMSDVDLRAKTIEIRGKGFRGVASRLMPLSPDTCRVLDAYMTERGGTSGHLICSRRSPQVGLTAHYIGEMVRDWMNEAGIKNGRYDGVSAHAFRHTAAEDIYEASGGNIRVVQQALGHANLSTTAQYQRRDVGGLDLVQRTRRSYLSMSDEQTDDIDRLLGVEPSGGPGGSDEVTDGPAHEGGIVTEPPETAVARMTQQPPHDPGEVVVIDTERVGGSATDGAESSLFF